MFASIFAVLSAVFAAIAAPAAAGPQVSPVSTRALIMSENGGPRCIAKFELDGLFALPEHCKPRMPGLSVATRWSLERGRLALTKADGVEVAVFAARGKVWRSVTAKDGPAWIIVFMTMEAEPQ
jgi:hypothetical protein